MRPVIKALGKVIDPIYQQQGFIRAKIILDWHLIMGDKFANFCVPEKIHFPFEKRTGGRLVIKTTSSFAVEISHFEPIIINRINQYFGYKAVERINISHTFMTPLRQKRRAIRVISEEQKVELEQQLEEINSPPLKKALFNLGAAILQKRDSQ